MDFFSGGFVIEPTKEIMGPDCKMLLWLSCSLASMPAYLTDYDFAAIAQEIYADDARRQGRSHEEILDQVCICELRSLSIPPADYRTCIAHFRLPWRGTGATSPLGRS
jgi:hypothetical protein